MAARKATQRDQSSAAGKQTATSATRLNPGPVDAPGKLHRKPPPQEPIDKRLGEPRGKQMVKRASRPVCVAGEVNGGQ